MTKYPYVFKLSLFSLILSIGAAPIAAQVRGATISGSAAVFIYVDTVSSAASDTAAGSVTAPLKTLGRAVELALQLNRRGVPVQVSIRPGVYRERISIPPQTGQTDALLALEGDPAGGTILAGSDIWTGWYGTSQSGEYTRTWPYRWGLAPYPAGWAGWIVLPDILRRREMVFVNGEPLVQALSRTAMRESTFFVDETIGQIYIRPKAGVAPSAARVEVAVRTNLLTISNRRNIVVRGLTIQHDAAMLGKGDANLGSTVTIVGSSNVLLENCQILRNSIYGLGLIESQQLTVRNVKINENGLAGLTAWKLSDTLIESSQTNANNWRGGAGAFYTWDAAGAKLMLIRSLTIRNHQALRNQGPGIWLDTDVKTASVENSFLEENYGAGLYVEAVQGPVSATGNRIANNRRGGVLVANSTKLTLDSNRFVTNSPSQLLISGDAGGRYMTDQDTGITTLLSTESIRFLRNSLEGSGTGHAFIGTTLAELVWNRFLYSSESDYNRYVNTLAPQGFQMPNAVRVPLATWVTLTGRDRNSTAQ